MDSFPEGPILQIWDSDTPPPSSSVTNSPPGSIRKIRNTSRKLRDDIKSFKDQLKEDSELYTQFHPIKHRYSLLEESLFRAGEALPIYQKDIERFEHIHTLINQKDCKRQIPTHGPLSVEQGIRHVELRNEEELYKLIRRERKIDIPALPNKIVPESFLMQAAPGVRSYLCISICQDLILGVCRPCCSLLLCYLQPNFSLVRSRNQSGLGSYTSELCTNSCIEASIYCS